MEVAALVVVQLTEELLRVLGLLVVLLLLDADVLELGIALHAGALAVIAVNAGVMVAMAAHEYNDRQLQVALAIVAFLRVEVLGLAIQLVDRLLEEPDVVHVLLELGSVLSDHVTLLVEALEQVFLEHLES